MRAIRIICGLVLIVAACFAGGFMFSEVLPLYTGHWAGFGVFMLSLVLSILPAFAGAWIIAARCHDQN